MNNTGGTSIAAVGCQHARSNPPTNKHAQPSLTLLEALLCLLLVQMEEALAHKVGHLLLIGQHQLVLRLLKVLRRSLWQAVVGDQ